MDYEFNVGDFIVSDKTIPTHYKISSGSTKPFSKLKEWGIIEGVPCVIKEKDECYLYVDSFTSSEKRIYIITQQFIHHFTKLKLEDNKIMGLSKYPNNYIDSLEFECRNQVKKFEDNIKYFMNKLEDGNIIKHILIDKFPQLLSAMGAPCMTIPEIEKIDINSAKTGIKRYDNRIFNRNSRWCPSIEMSYDEYKDSNSFCYPIGIRPKDYCLPSELIDTIKEMIKQIACFKNIDPVTKKSLLDLINVDEYTCKECHKCKYCGKVIDAIDYSSTYSSKDNFIEICHRDPNERFIPSNMYWGHGECNRQQGGYSEEDRIDQVLRLIKNNPDWIQSIKENSEWKHLAQELIK